MPFTLKRIVARITTLLDDPKLGELIETYYEVISNMDDPPDSLDRELITALEEQLEARGQPILL